jgi:3-deoxy-7-phosphoheptulonate synthase
LFEGNQSIPANLADMRYGVSVTDACLGWDVTERALRWGRDALKQGR